MIDWRLWQICNEKVPLITHADRPVPYQQETSLVATMECSVVAHLRSTLNTQYDIDWQDCYVYEMLLIHGISTNLVCFTLNQSNSFSSVRCYKIHLPKFKSSAVQLVLEVNTAVFYCVFHIKLVLLMFNGVKNNIEQLTFSHFFRILLRKRS